MKKFIVSLMLVVAFVLPLAITGSMAEGGSDSTAIPDDTLVEYGYLKTFKEQLKAELLAELSANGGNITVSSDSNYNEVSVNEGEVIILEANTEIIYRGGGAVVISVSNDGNNGITDMSAGVELFSGELLTYGHIYHSSDGESRKAILVTGEKAYFTVRGDYEIA